MLKSMSSFGAAALIALGLAFVGTSADADSLVIAGMGGAAGPGTQSAPAAAPAPTPRQAPAPRGAKSKTACRAEYAANKAAIKASGQTKRSFVAACRAGQDAFSRGLSGIKE